MDRFLGISSSSSSYSSSSSSSSSSSAVAANNGSDELNEDDILWTNDATELQEEQNSTITSNTSNRRQIFAHNSGILAALPETKRYEVLYRKPNIPLTTRMGTSIPRPPLQEREWFSGSRKLQQQSAPVNVPLLSMAVARERNKKLREVDYDDDGDEEMLPPHEIVIRGSGMSPKTTFSVLEGAGRTLKGRDLRRVRNAVWRKTGFLD